MVLPPLQAMHDSQSRSIGDVVIHPSAAIAPGVLLQAEEGSRIVIGASVCVGMGTVIHAYGGALEIQEGVNLGAGVLMLGSGVIGAYACVGTSCTVMEWSVASRAVIPPGSLLGDRSRSVQSSVPQPVASPASPEATQSSDPWQEESAHSGDPSGNSSDNPSGDPSGSTFVYPTSADLTRPSTSTVASSNPANLNGGAKGSEAGKTSTIHGKDYVNGLLTTLLPHRAHSHS
ncbi:MAG: hypothetical protein MH252_10060 [Thermosynechococcaceae cyanobacterium MS004]|nr:hypothetical protein [Thermosynechococcaceae cyanobacterium MS004]